MALANLTTNNFFQALNQNVPKVALVVTVIKGKNMADWNSFAENAIHPTQSFLIKIKASNSDSF